MGYPGFARAAVDNNGPVDHIVTHIAVVRMAVAVGGIEPGTLLVGEGESVVDLCFDCQLN